jgi:hypothetical protein
MTLDFDPPPRWAMELRNARGLHGALTALRDRPHTRYPAWSLVPWQSGWGVYFADLTEARGWAGKNFHGSLWDKPTVFRFGHLLRFKAPVDVKRGRSRVRIDAITPIITRSLGGSNPCTCPNNDTLRGALAGELLYKISPNHRNDAPDGDEWASYVRPQVQIEIIERQTEATYTPLGGKFGTIAGWQGHVVAEVNAVALWLLLATERAMGLGGRVAFGFGRIRVTSC